MAETAETQQAITYEYTQSATAMASPPVSAPRLPHAPAPAKELKDADSTVARKLFVSPRGEEPTVRTVITG